MADSERTDEQIETRSLIYEPNPKHKPIPTPGRHGSICPSGANGPLLLSQSYLVGKKRYATDGEDAYCAQQHAPDTWHGYPVSWHEVPPQLIAQWVAAERVQRRTIQKAKRRRKG